MEKSKRRSFNNSLDEDLYIELKVLSIRKKIKINQLFGAGMKYVIEKYKGSEYRQGVMCNECYRY
ncbi:hypothetical protein NE172_18670 [Clostridium botulinum]|uniref:hypothetical protein n=1 Tax=Clostridium botulinum TaxID=1491 RepID=UPI0001AAD668|nr:hypothetical protein [Clostridium botulinum]EES51106.1 hypothetical protein CLO_3454 [Clostridium botulinum E1 str. 'BoNT E Beluga']MBY6762567.1 hypothetical protein [Clostridium botulinum]MCR1132923.1 hypothetical protein [Clostridium botulinum]NFJ58982.1 hypothetical protein [Clostridium botulinum]NFS15449.1 hypothetical protein [Clostridium botulinum]